MDTSLQNLQSFIAQAEGMMEIGKELAINKTLFISVVSQFIKAQRRSEPFFDKEDITAIRELIDFAKVKVNAVSNNSEDTQADVSERTILENVQKFTQDPIAGIAVDKIFSVLPRRINAIIEDVQEEAPQEALKNVFNSLSKLNLEQLAEVKNLLDETPSQDSLLLTQWLDQADEATIEKVLTQIDQNVTNDLLANIAYHAVKAYEKFEELTQHKNEFSNPTAFSNLLQDITTTLFIQRIDNLLESIKPVFQIVEDALVQNIPSIDLTDYVETRKTENRRTKTLIASFKPQ